MSILLLLIPLSLMLVGVAAWAFAWAVRRGQFDDLDTPALDILGDDHREADPVRGPGGDADGASGHGGNGDGDGDGDVNAAD